MNTYLTSFLLSFSTMFVAHYMLEPTWKIDEPRSTSWRMILNYSIGTFGIGLAFLYQHPDLWFDFLVSVAGAGSATMLAHSRDWLMHLIKRDRAHGLIEDSQTKS